MKTEKEQNKFRAAVTVGVEKKISEMGSTRVTFLDIPGIDGNLDLTLEGARRMHKELNKLFGVIK